MNWRSGCRTLLLVRLDRIASVWSNLGSSSMARRVALIKGSELRH